LNGQVGVDVDRIAVYSRDDSRGAALRPNDSGMGRVTEKERLIVRGVQRQAVGEDVGSAGGKRGHRAAIVANLEQALVLGEINLLTGRIDREAGDHALGR